MGGPGGWYGRLQNGFNSGFFAVPRTLGNALAAGSNDIGLTGLVNRLTGKPILPTPEQEQATNAAVQSRFDAAPQGGFAGALGNLGGLGLATLPAAEGAVGLLGRGLSMAGEAIPGASAGFNAIRNFLTGGARAEGLARIPVEGASLAARGAL